VKAPVALRSSEWLLIGYFAYVAAIAPAFPLQPAVAHLPLAVAVLVALLLVVLSRSEIFNIPRDWIPLGLTLLAYREMDWFSSPMKDHHLELQWIQWDRAILHGAGLQRTIESLGALLPAYLELCYLVVYAVGPFTVAVVYFLHRRELANRVVFVYVLGTALAYGLFPYFPSDPPRTLFGDTDLSNIATAVRRFNLWIVGGYGIHSSVFPSAHVSSAFSAAWAFFLFLPDRKRFGRGMLIYAASVAIATVYGRYHYAVDVVAGFGVSLVAAATTRLFLRLRRARGLL
jgi:membrane-associated phospholipid phosphatase